MVKCIWWCAFALIVLPLAACVPEASPDTTADRTGDAGPSEAFNTGELVKSEHPLVESDVDGESVGLVVDADRALGIDLLVATAGDDNWMISPYSVATALSMMYPGARGETAEEIAAVMHLAVDDETLHGVRNRMETLLGTPSGPQSDDDDREPFTIRPANSAWGQGGYPFLEDYLSILAENYGAGLRVLDYRNDPAGSTTTINDWVEEATENRIQDLIPDGAINNLTRLVLVNAIWFKANWAIPFEPGQTQEGSFTRLDGSSASVPMMTANFKTDYAEDDQFQFLRLAYAGDAAMIIALPKNQASTPPAALVRTSTMDIAWEERQVEMMLPRFEFHTDLALKDTLRALGMETVFVSPAGDQGADLTGIIEDRVLFLSDAFHQTYVAVDEQGTEAAAATALVLLEVSAGREAPSFTVDRPFLFWIEDTITGEPLFLGQVTDPVTD